MSIPLARIVFADPHFLFPTIHPSTHIQLANPYIMSQTDTPSKTGVLRSCIDAIKPSHYAAFGLVNTSAFSTDGTSDEIGEIHIAMFTSEAHKTRTDDFPSRTIKDSDLPSGLSVNEELLTKLKDLLRDTEDEYTMKKRDASGQPLSLKATAAAWPPVFKVTGDCTVRLSVPIRPFDRSTPGEPEGDRHAIVKIELSSRRSDGGSELAEGAGKR